jgi:hypothetical protein
MCSCKSKASLFLFLRRFWLLGLAMLLRKKSEEAKELLGSTRLSLVDRRAAGRAEGLALLFFPLVRGWAKTGRTETPPF